MPLPEQGGLSSTSPRGSDPFDSAFSNLPAHFVLHQSRVTLVLLLVLMSFHFLIFSFCLIILTLPYFRGEWRSQWFLKRIYIRRPRGGVGYKTPLYLINVGTAMTLSQLLSSVSAEVYLGMRLHNAVKPSVPVPPEFPATLALVFLFEFFAYWFLSHGILVTCYFSRKLQAHNFPSLDRQSLIPRLINTFFFSVPTCAAVAVLSTLEPTIRAQRQFKILLENLWITLQKGSYFWRQSQVASLSEDQKLQLSADLARCIFNLKQLQLDTAVAVKKLEHQTRIFQAAPLTLMSVSLMVFSFMLCNLIQIYRHQSFTLGRSSSQKSALCDQSHKDSLDDGGTGKVYSSSLKSNTELRPLMLRAFAILTAILTNLIGSLIIVLKASEIVMSPRWGGFTSWIIVAGGTWSAIPVAYQCWRLWVEERDGPLDMAPNSQSSGPKAGLRNPASISDTEKMSLESKIDA